MKILELKNVYKEFVDGNHTITALKPTSLQINAGEVVAIIGPSGSGKSTLLTLMAGLQKPTGGRIEFLKKDMAKLTPKENNELRLHQIGFVLQSSNLVPFLRVKEQFQLVDLMIKEDYSVEQANHLLATMGILQRKNLYPSELSGGERQRAAICRALYPKPRLLLTDEPTANLDTKKSREVISLLVRKTKGTNRATIIVTHDTRLLSYCDRVFQIIDGYVEELVDTKNLS